MSRPGEDVLGVLAAAEVDPVLLVVGELVLAAVAVVDEGRRHASPRVGLVVEERDRDVVGVELRAAVARGDPRAALPAVNSSVSNRAQHVGVPQGEVAALAVVAAGLLPQAEDRVLLAAATPERERVVERGVGPVAALGVLRGLDHR